MWGWQKQTASDTVHAVTALLDMTTAKQLEAHDDAKDRFWYICLMSAVHAHTWEGNGFPCQCVCGTRPVSAQPLGCN